MKPSILTELSALPPIHPERLRHLTESSLEISLIIPARSSHHTLSKTVQEAHEFLKARYAKSFEIILVPNPAPNEPEDQSTQVAHALEQKYSEVRVCPHTFPRGKGAALRTGFLASRGRLIFFTDADLPYDLSFFDEAAHQLKQGYHFVHGNRRLAESQFSIPVRLLQIAYSRHRLGLGFNRCVRTLLPISTTDTQAGIKALSRTLALEFFSRQACPGFLFDLEIFLTAEALRLPTAALPVTLYLNSEKSTVRILRECLLVMNWLTKIKLRQIQGKYGKNTRAPVLQRYQKAPVPTRLFLAARWWLTPYSRMSAYLPIEGRILDLGCGHGLFAIAAAMQSTQREILALDHDGERIQAASEATRDLHQIRWSQGDLITLPTDTPPFGGIAMIDVLHYFNPDHQISLLRSAYHRLNPGGVLLIREVNPQGGWVSQWNRWYEKIATGIGFTQSKHEALTFRSKQDWETALRSIGFQVSSEPCSSVLFADILYVCRKPAYESQNANL